ncbi:MAG: folate-binding protein YgfZ [Fulvimarina manganoxydans]|uniref:CAF17-like 4Fe-4S cluster assembly/insertion protein YgfZ n=1 Tax=Fulvimarina manganoxydans TaxID=937218 RepID=UPI002352F86A|nr:folate-binding protein [Fulvimarina manganoxydans]MCK5934262.1 folate-binding protein YgfZ [Fulvimarina manganoxydans]
MPISRLTDRACLLVEGAEAEHFLQNLITADIPSIAPGQMRPSALLTPQGKILFDFLVGRTDAGFRLECAASVRDALAKRLTLYKLRAKATISSDEAPIHTLFDEAPSNDATAIYVDDRFAKDAVYRLYGPLADEAELAPAEAYHDRRIRAGVAEAETDYPASELFPHDVLLDQNGGVSFKKGCFVGQEVVSRMQHRGTARRRLMLLEGDGHLTPGANVTAGGPAAIGTVYGAAGDTGFAVLRIDKLAKALAEGQTIAVDGVPVEASVPPWAGFALAAAPDESEAENAS